MIILLALLGFIAVIRHLYLHHVKYHQLSFAELKIEAHVVQGEQFFTYMQDGN